jgi:predicted nucleic acid-binding protein
MADDLALVDTNIFLRLLRQDHPDHSPRASAFLARIEAGVERARTADTVVFETVFTLERTYRQPRAEIRRLLLPLLLLRNLVLPNKRRIRRTFDLYLIHPALSFADCYHVALMEGLSLTRIVSFDEKLRQVTTISRTEPNSSGELA